MDICLNRREAKDLIKILENAGDDGWTIDGESAELFADSIRKRFGMISRATERRRAWAKDKRRKKEFTMDCKTYVGDFGTLSIAPNSIFFP